MTRPFYGPFGQPSSKSYNYTINSIDTAISNLINAIIPPANINECSSENTSECRGCSFGCSSGLGWSANSSLSTFRINGACNDPILNPQPSQYEECGQVFLDAVKQWMEDNGWRIVDSGLTKSQKTWPLGSELPEGDCEIWSQVIMGISACCDGGPPGGSWWPPPCGTCYGESECAEGCECVDDFYCQSTTWLNPYDLRPSNCYMMPYNIRAGFSDGVGEFYGHSIPPCMENPLP